MIMPGGESDTVRATGGQVDEMVLALVDVAYDKEGSVRSSMMSSLCELGRRQPSLVLSTCLSYLIRHSKLPQGHRVVILSVMEKVVKQAGDSLDKPLAVDLIKQVSIELTHNKEIVPEWQTAASNVLVAIGCSFCNEVMEDLLQKFQPGVLPHFFVIQTMSNLAVANVYGMVPFLSVVLGTMLPMLGMAKQDNMRWVISSALAKFSESILDYVANIEKAPDPGVKKEAFAGEIFAAYDVLFTVWLQSKEPKLRLSIVEALGHMTHIMTRDKLEEQLPKLLQGILGLYRRHPEPFHITQGLCMVLDASTSDGSTILDPHLDNMLNTLFAQVTQPVDYSNPMTVKNHNEVLRCFHVLARSFSDRVVGFLLQKLEVTNEKVRTGALSVLRHLVNSAGDHMENKKALLLSGLKHVLNDQNNRVKKALAQVVMAMSHHGYLEHEGGHLMIEFIVSQCAPSAEPPGTKRPQDPEYVSSEALRSMCDNVLHMLSTTVEGMDVVLWPYLLEFIVPVNYSEAIGTLTRSIGHISSLKREGEADDYEIDYEKEVNIPKPAAIIARLLVMLGRPTNGRNRGLHVLSAMTGLVPNLHDGLVTLWDTVIPKLVQFLEDAVEKDEGFPQKGWEDLVLKLLSKSLDEVDSEDWVVELGEAFGNQIPLYQHYSEEKNFLYKCLGITMRKSTNKDFVNKHLEKVLRSVNHASQDEREGCAIAMGFSATSHLDAVLSKLENAARLEGRKSSGLLGFIKDQVRSDMDERMKATMMLCYGYVTFYSPPSLIVSRLETTILKAINPHFPSVKDTAVKQNLIRTVELIGKAMHPLHLQTNHTFRNRGDLLKHMQNYLKAEPSTHLPNDTRALTMQACATLVKLDPPLTPVETFDLLQAALEKIVVLPPGGSRDKRGKEETYEDLLGQEKLMDITMASFRDLVHDILLRDMTPGGIDSIYQHLHVYSLSPSEHERERALSLTQHTFQLYMENMSVTLGEAVSFSNLGILLARLIPRCSDPSVIVRQTAIDCVQLLLKIGLRYQGHGPEHRDSMVDALPTLKDRSKKSDPNNLFSVVNDLSKVLSKSLPSDQLVPFLTQLQDGLSDPQDNSSSGACVVLNSVVKTRGAELQAQVESIVQGLHSKLSVIVCPQTRTGTLRTVRTLASHQLLSVMNTLLAYPLPLDQHLVECWRILAGDPTLLASIIDHLLDLLARSLPYEEKPTSRSSDPPTRTATHMPLAATCALTELLGVEEAEQPVQNTYERLFAAICTMMSSMVGVKPPKPLPKDDKKDKKSGSKQQSAPKEVDIKPCRVSVETLRQLLTCCHNDDLLDSLGTEEVWAQFEEEEKYPEAYTTLAKLLVEYQPKHVAKLIASLTPVLGSVYEPQRIMAAAIFAEMINQKCAGDLALVELLVNSLLGRLVDSSHRVRMLCIRGLGNVASVGPEQVQKYSTTVLSAMMAGMDDKDDVEDDITLEAMCGLSRILAEIDESHIRAILINISLRIRPCFEKEKAAVRAAAVTLFGNLSRFGDGPSRAPFLEQIHTNLVSLLLHLNDPDTEVRKACKKSLQQLGPLLESESINSMFQKFLIEDAMLHYGEFMNDLSKVIIQDFPDKLNFYVMGNVTFFRSTWSEIKSNAAMFVGFLLGNMDQEQYLSISKEHVCGALILLLKDPASDVRIKAAEAMSRLHQF